MPRIEAAGLTTPLIMLISAYREFDVKCEPMAGVGDGGDVPGVPLAAYGKREFRLVDSRPGETEQL